MSYRGCQISICHPVRIYLAQKTYVQYLISFFVVHIMFRSTWNVPCAHNYCASATWCREKQKNISQMSSPGMLAHLIKALFCIPIYFIILQWIFLCFIVNALTARHAGVALCACQCSLVKFYHLWTYWRDTLQRVILWMCHIQATGSKTR